jgi:thiol-disulfide isomerase/thioredoxin
MRSIGSLRNVNARVLGLAAIAATGAAGLDLSGAAGWFNTAPVRVESLRGKVVLVDIWTYSCINSLRELPYVQAWAAKYKAAGLVVIGVHSPEFPFEKEHANVGWAVRNFRVVYPVPMDNNYAIWHSLDNEYWPADYLIDGRGRVRYHHFGEGDYAESERAIQRLLKENGATNVPEGTVGSTGVGIEQPPSESVASPETYIGTARAERRVDPVPVPVSLSLNQWGLIGQWTVVAQSGVLQSTPGAIVFRFHARDLHLIMSATKPVRFKVTLDGAAPGDSHGLDIAPDGSGAIREPRLYQLIRQKGPVQDRTFRIEFLDPGAEAYSFTFG